jgi:serine/threonine protein kinase
LEPGSVLAARYQVNRLLKTGGMGAVYEVLDLRTQRLLALKTLLPGSVPDPEAWDRFQREARLTAHIRSEHLVKVEDAGIAEASGVAFFTMELLDGEDLEAIVRKDGGLPPKLVVELIRQVSSGLEHLHNANIFHRDLKPENLFLTRRDDGSALVKILDLGVAKVVRDERTRTRTVGSPLYMPIEQFRGESPDARSDTFALGHIVFFLLTGRAFLEAGADPTERASRRATRHGISLPRTFDAWFQEATAEDPSRRFDSASELAAELPRALGFRLSSEPVPPLATEARQRRPRSFRRALLLGPVSIAVLLLGGFVGVSSWKRSGATGYGIQPSEVASPLRFNPNSVRLSSTRTEPLAFQGALEAVALPASSTQKTIPPRAPAAAPQKANSTAGGFGPKGAMRRRVAQDDPFSEH